MLVPLDAAYQESTFGGKAVGLGDAIRAGLRVPPGVALGAPLVDALADGRDDALAMLLDSKHIPSGRLAIRSSAIGEDSADASFAGQHATKLNVVRTRIPEAVRAVWESGRSDSALAYRQRKGLPATPRMGIVVQVLIEPVAAGVLFTRNPVTGADERMIEATWGLGEAVVNGMVVPDLFRLDAQGRLIEVTPGSKDVKVWYGDGEGTIEMPVAPELHSIPCLAPAVLDALHEMAERCRRVWGADLDIEWALGPDASVYLLQCRPITTLRSVAS